MKAATVLLASVLVLPACSQAINYTYSKRNFTSSAFEADLSACKHHRSSVTAYQPSPREQQDEMDEATVRDCMKTKGYKIESE
jgi:ABC-type glycerol-3-phosphate transport system substrate-binding protein